MTVSDISLRRLQDPGEDPNTDVYDSDEAVERYTEEIRQRGLFDNEEDVIEGYFGEPGAAVIDVGCGTGRTTKALADRGFDVVGVDQSRSMIEAAREDYADIEFRVDDATDLSDPDGVFDYALFSYNGLDCIYPKAQRVQALREIHRVLRSGGVFAFSSHNWLYVFPALVSDFGHVRRYYLTNGNLRRLGSSYKKDATEFGLFMHWGNPWRITARLEDCGFELLERVTKRESPLKFFETSHYYVAKKRKGASLRK